MKQSRFMSLVEAITNVLVGYGIAVVTQLVVFPWFGLPAHLDDALAIGGIYTVISLIRSFLLRRLFEAVRIRGTGESAAADHRRAAAVRGQRRRIVL